MVFLLSQNILKWNENEEMITNFLIIKNQN